MKDPASGTSDLVVNDVGSPRLHERHRVILEKEEGEVVSRARVTDQLEIDRLLLSGKIDTVEHKSAEERQPERCPLHGQGHRDI